MKRCLRTHISLSVSQGHVGSALCSWSSSSSLMS
jgi:hypothetical protein